MGDEGGCPVVDFEAVRAARIRDHRELMRGREMTAAFISAARRDLPVEVLARALVSYGLELLTRHEGSSSAREHAKKSLGSLQTSSA